MGKRLFHDIVTIGSENGLLPIRHQDITWTSGWNVYGHYRDVIMSAMASQITGVPIVYSAVCSGRSKKTSKLRVTGLCKGNSPVTDEFHAQRASNTKNVSIWWRHHDIWSVRFDCRWNRTPKLTHACKPINVWNAFLLCRNAIENNVTVPKDSSQRELFSGAFQIQKLEFLNIDRKGKYT